MDTERQSFNLGILMSEKPALYVVEKKEVVILVVLFVLVTVLAFTMGVRYGESVGKKAALSQAQAEGEIGADHAEHTGGTLGATGGGAEHDEEDSHGAAAGHGKEAPAAHGKEAASGHGEKTEAPKAVAKSAPEPSEAPGRDAADKNSDEYLLNALKDSGVEPPGGKAPNDAKLPSDVKRAKSGAYVIQVGSHPTKGEAESQVRMLSSKKIDAEILAPFKDRQGEWHRVVIGSYKTKREAEKEAGQLKAKGAILSYFVWRLP